MRVYHLFDTQAHVKSARLKLIYIVYNYKNLYYNIKKLIQAASYIYIREIYSFTNMKILTTFSYFYMTSSHKKVSV